MEENKDIRAPYNFIPLPKKVVKKYNDVQQLPSHSSMGKELLSGIIKYKVTAISDIFVGDGTGGEFYRSASGEYAIPGSNMRGLLRNNAQILSSGFFGNDFEDFRLMYRMVGGKKSDLKTQYQQILGTTPSSYVSGNVRRKISVQKNVKAGYIKKENGNYYIYNTKIKGFNTKDYGEMNYYPLRETTIFGEYNRAKQAGKENHFEILKNSDEDDRFLQHIGTKFEKGKIKDDKNDNYRPQYMAISYKLKNTKDVIAVGKVGKYSKTGYIITTGPMNMKKTMYIIPEIADESEGNVIKVGPEDVDSFRRDLEAKKTYPVIKDNMEFFSLPKEGEIKPVFYIYDKSKLMFGFTPNLRLFYNHSVGDGIPEEHKKGMQGERCVTPVLDYANSMFGYIADESSYKSRVYVENAEIVKETGLSTEWNGVLAEPKASSYLDYLKQVENEQKTYNSDEFEIRGIKQYWLKKGEIPYGECGESNAVSGFQPLKKGAEFQGTIHYKNLTEDELGLLLWSLRLEDSSEQNIGKAKAYGYGRIKISDITVSSFDFEKMYSDELNFDPYQEKEKTVNEYVDIYKAEIGKHIGKDIMDTEFVKAFLIMKNSGKIPDNGKTSYMPIGMYKNRMEPLPTPESVLNGKKDRVPRQNTTKYKKGR